MLQEFITGKYKLFYKIIKTKKNCILTFFRVYYRRIGVDEERDFQQQTLQHLGSMCSGDFCRGMYVVKIQRKYFFTEHEVKVQVFNDICPHESCDGPTSNESTIYSAEDLPQVAPTRVNFCD